MSPRIIAEERKWPVVFIGSILLLIPALFNGYPILGADSASYLGSGFEFDTLRDRPITYGLFVFFSSIGGFSLWSTIVIQSLILAELIVSFFFRALASKDKLRFWLSLLLTFVLSGIGFNSSQVMADVFTAIMVFSFLELLLGQGSGLTRRTYLWVVFTIAFGMHLSHLPILLVLLVAATVIWSPKYVRSQLGAFLLVSLGIGFLPMSSALAKSSHVFFAGKMAEHGIIQEYLHDHCEENEFQLCDYGEIPRDHVHFIWAEDSPMSLFANWNEAEAELSTIIQATFSEWKYAQMHIYFTMRASLLQLFVSGFGDGTGEYSAGDDVIQRLQEHLPHEVVKAMNSRQRRGELDGFNLRYFTQAHRVLKIVLILMLAGVMYFRRRTLHKVPLFLILSYAACCAMSASLAMISDRFGLRASVLFVAGVSLFLFAERKMVNT